MRRNGGFSRKRPARMDWECAQATATLQAAQGHVCAYLIGPDTFRDFYTSPTVLVTRVFCQIFQLSAGQSPGSVPIAAIGIIDWKDRDSAAPDVTANECPRPLTDCDLDWMGRWVSPGFPVGTPQATFPFGLGPNIFDNTHLVKSRRKLENSEGLLVSFETLGMDAAFSIDARFLIKQV